jgi:flagellar hook-basal body complex protein FliE
MMDAKNVSGVLNLLQRTQELQQRSADLARTGDLESSSVTTKFSDDISNAIKDIKAIQQQSAETKTQFEYSSDIPITQVVLDSQKSSIAFEATLQIRNKVLKAYQDIMSMPV